MLIVWFKTTFKSCCTVSRS